jgi:hypothetical protein
MESDDLLFDTKGIIFQHCLPQKQSVNGVHYANTLKTHFRNAIQGKKTQQQQQNNNNRSHFLMKWWFLLQDNAWLHITHDNGGTSRHQRNTSRTPTLQSRPCPI